MVFLSFPQNSEAAHAYQQMVAARVNPSSFDSACHRVNYSLGSDFSTGSTRDRRIDSCELWTAYSEYASRTSAITNIFREQVPWFYDSVSLSPQSRQILQDLDSKIAELRIQTASSPQTPLQMARGLYHWLTTEFWILSVNQVEEEGLLASLENHRANCSEFFSIFKFAFERAGLSVRPVFVFESANGDHSEHIATLFQYAGQNYLMDPLYHSFEAQHRRWVTLSLREFWAWHFNNRATLLDISRRGEMLRLFARAEHLDAANPHFPNNLGLKLEEIGELRAAELAYQRSIQIDPHFVEPYVNKSALLLDQGRSREALICAQAGLVQHLGEARLHYNAALAYFNLGRLEEALAAIDRAMSYLSIPSPDYNALRSDIQAQTPH